LDAFYRVEKRRKKEEERACECIVLNNTNQDHELDTACSASAASQHWHRKNPQALHLQVFLTGSDLRHPVQV